MSWKILDEALELPSLKSETLLQRISNLKVVEADRPFAGKAPGKHRGVTRKANFGWSGAPREKLLSYKVNKLLSY